MKIKNDRKNQAEASCELYFGKEPEELSVLPKAEEMIQAAIQETLNYEDFFAPVYIMNAIDRAIKSGEEEVIRL